MSKEDPTIDDWFTVVELPISWEQFLQLPRNGDFKYEYFDGKAWLSPRPRGFNAVLDLSGPDAETAPLAGNREQIEIRPIENTDRDWDQLIQPFCGAFDRLQPIAGLSDTERARAAELLLGKTRRGGDGPVVWEASQIATSGGYQDGSRRVAGALLVTLMPHGDITDFDAYQWGKEGPPEDAVAGKKGRAHLIWIFVAPMLALQGVGSAMLNEAVKSLRSMGFGQLTSSFWCGNERSVLWHWRNGFQLLEYPGSRRKINRSISEQGKVKS